jgi:TetR/AcrR family transcriptional repressor of mexJK operon
MTITSEGIAATPGPPRRPEPTARDRSARKRDAITDAATQLFLRNGYLGTSMDQIAALAAVSKPTVYKHFPDKEQLFTEIVLGSLDQAGDPFRAELEALANTNQLEEDLRGIAVRYLAAVMQPLVLQLRRLVIGASHQLPGLARAYYDRAPERTIRALSACFATLAARGLLTADSPDAAASHFAFLVIGRALDKSLFCGDQPFTAAELAAQAEAAVTTFLAAYARKPGQQRARRQPGHAG